MLSLSARAAQPAHPLPIVQHDGRHNELHGPWFVPTDPACSISHFHPSHTPPAPPPFSTEVLEKAYDERSDMWSMGCILLDIVTCGFLDVGFCFLQESQDEPPPPPLTSHPPIPSHPHHTSQHQQSQSVLFEIKHSSQRLEEVLKEVAKTYSKDLCQLIRAMLRRNYKQRQTADELIQLPYVRSCLELSNSELVKDAKKRAAADPGVKPTTTKRFVCWLPSWQAPPSPLNPPPPPSQHPRQGARYHCLSQNKPGACRLPGHGHGGPSQDSRKDKSVQLSLMHHSAPSPSRPVVLTPPSQMKHAKYQTESTLSKEGKEQILSSMATHAENAFVQVAACQVLRYLATNTAGEGDVVFSAPFIKAVLLALRSHPSSAELQKEGCSLIWALATDEVCAALIGQEGGVQDVLAALRDNAEDPDIAQACCGALWSLAVSEANAKIITDEQGIQDLANAMQVHSGNAALLESACAALWSLSVEDENVDLIFDLNCVGMMVKALVDHLAQPKLVKQACIALASLVVDENCAFSVVTNDLEVEGITAILHALKTHTNDAEVVENATTLIAELAEHGTCARVVLHPDFLCSNFTPLSPQWKCASRWWKRAQPSC